MSFIAELSTVEWLIICLVWLIASFGSAAALAKLYKRLYSELSFTKLWAFWTILLSIAAAAALALI